ncbi:calphotin-like [Chelonus insularis]|uniref:calphotin-like n=1 Tax=Chelonus insularis TaxID=460826 RepID=UPI00158DC91B|nr:calphotin-like [Chelonus insularis]
MILNVNMSLVMFMAMIGVSLAGIIPAAPVALAPAAPAPLVASAPVVAPAAIGYTKAVPYNIPPFASRVDYNARALAAPYIAAPAPIVAAPAPAPIVAAPGVVSSPYLAAPFGPFAPAAYTAVSLETPPDRLGGSNWVWPLIDQRPSSIKMMTKCIIFFFALVAICSAGLVPAAVPAALTVGTYASSYNAHAVNHAYAAPYVAAPAVAAAPLAYSAYPYSYSAIPATYAAAPIFAARR